MWGVESGKEVENGEMRRKNEGILGISNGKTRKTEVKNKAENVVSNCKQSKRVIAKCGDPC